MKSAQEKNIEEEFTFDSIMTYEDIDVEALEYLPIFELRDLAFKTGVACPMSKTQDELVKEITKTVEREMSYYYVC